MNSGELYTPLTNELRDAIRERVARAGGVNEASYDSRVPERTIRILICGKRKFVSMSVLDRVLEPEDLSYLDLDWAPWGSIMESVGCKVVNFQGKIPNDADWEWDDRKKQWKRSEAWRAGQRFDPEREMRR